MDEGVGRHHDEDDGDGGAIGIFPNWWWLYATVVLYTAALIAVLRLFTLAFDFGESAP